MKLNININKKLLIAIVGFLFLFIVISVIFVIFSTQSRQSNNNPGGTGGDYTPPNTLTITNEGTIYQALGGSITTSIHTLLSDAIVYNISITDNQSAPSGYIQMSNFNNNTGKYKIYKPGKSYSAVLDNNAINQYTDPQWDYWMTFSVNDGRHFRVDSVNDANGNPHYTVKKM